MNDKVISFCCRVLEWIGLGFFALGSLAIPFDKGWNGLPLTERCFIAAIVFIVVSIVGRNE